MLRFFENSSYQANDITAHRTTCFDANSNTRVMTQLVDNGSGSRVRAVLEVELDIQLLLGMLPQLTEPGY